MYIPKAVKTALEMMSEASFSAYLVGGSLRDLVLGRAQTDFDLASNALPAEVQSLFNNFTVVPTGLQHGTVTVVIEGTPIEITTLRKDGEYSDARRPDSVIYTDKLEEDLQRRDFTMNALALPAKQVLSDEQWEPIDLYGGIKDLENRLIRCVGDPVKRFSEDALRILRGLRFASVLGFTIEEKTLSAMKICAHKLTAISAERIAKELEGILCGVDAARVLVENIEILGVVLPELLPMRNFAQNTPYHIHDVLTHTAVVVKNSPPTFHLRLAALLHDIGKPHSYTVDKKGIGHFYGHATHSLRIAENILDRLKVSNCLREQVLPLVRYHDAPIAPTKKAIKRWLNKLSPSLFYDLLAVKRADNLGQNLAYANRQKEIDNLFSLTDTILAEGSCFTLAALAVDGNDLLAIGYQPGKKLGETLNMLLQAVVNEEVENRKEDLLLFAKKYAKK